MSTEVYMDYFSFGQLNGHSDPSWLAINEDDVIHEVMPVKVDPSLTPAPITGLDEVAECPGIVEHGIPCAMTLTLGAQGLEMVGPAFDR